MSTSAAPPAPSAEYLQDCAWIERHVEELVRDHANQWVAVHQGRVVAAGPDLGVVAAAARQAFPTGDVAYQFVDDGTLVFGS